jgi:RimJ/RimL family protein N-acetyltransferase
MTGGMVVRRGRVEDTPAMLQITRDVWEGHDYVPRVWTSWLSDNRGILLVAEAEGTMVGFQHVALHPDHSAWMEGIRVRADLQGSGVGSRLLAAGIDWARFSALTSVRLSTAGPNPASNRMAERAGFRTVGRFASVRVNVKGRAASQIARLARPDELVEVRASLDRTGDSQFYTEGWTAYRLTDERLGSLLAAAQVLVAGPSRIEAVGIVTATPDRLEPRPGLLAGDPGAIASILASLESTLRQLGAEFSRGQVQMSAETLRALEPYGLQRAWEHDMLLWELELEAAGSDGGGSGDPIL